VIDCCLATHEPSVSYIVARTSYISIRW